MDQDQVQIEAPVFPWQHVRKMGEDIVATELLFPRNHHRSPPTASGPCFQEGFSRYPGPEKTKSTDHSHWIRAGGLAKAPIEAPETRPGLETNSVVLGKASLKPGAGNTIGMTWFVMMLETLTQMRPGSAG